MPSQHTPTTTLATDADTTTSLMTAQQGDKDVIIVTTWDISHIYANQDTPTAKDTPQEDQATEDTVEDPLADLPVDQVAEADHTTDALGDTEAPHHTPLTLSPPQDQMQYHPMTQKTVQHN